MVKRALGIAAGAGVAALLMLVLAFAAVQTGAGKAWLAGAIGTALSDPSERVTVSGLDGVVPFDLRIGGIVWTDAAGPRLRVDGVRLELSARDLLAGSVTISRLTIARVEILRPGTAHGETDWAALLHPPLPVSIRHFAVGTVVLGKPVLGTALTVAASGDFALGTGRADADLALHRTDGAPGSATLHVAYGGAVPRLQMRAAVSEPTGTVLAALLDRNESLPLALSLTGDGPLDDWRGRLQATAGSAASATASFRISGSAPYRLSASAEAHVAALLPPALRQAIGATIAVQASAAIAADSIAVDRLDVTAAGFVLDAQGHYALDGGALAATAHVSAADLARLMPALGGSGEATLTFGGTLAAPVAVTGTGTVVGLTIAGTALPAQLGAMIGWQIEARVDPQKREIAAQHLVISDRGNAVTARVTATLEGAVGTLGLTVPDLAPLDRGTLAGALDLAADFRVAADGTATVSLSGNVAAPHSGVARLDALLGNRIAFAGTIERRGDGTLAARQVSADAAAVRLSGTAERRPDGTLATDFEIALPRLATLDPRLVGAATVTGHLAGPPAALAGKLDIAAPSLRAASVDLGPFTAQVALAGIAPPHGTIKAHFRAAGIDTTVTAAGGLVPGGVRITRFAASAPDGARLDGSLTLAAGRLDGKVHGSIPDLRPWSSLAGMPLSGRVAADATLAGKRVSATLDARDLRRGGAAPARIGRLHVAAEIADPLGRPTGRATLTVSDAAFGRLTASTVRFGARSLRPGHFTLDAAARGRAGEDFALAAGASLGLERGVGTLAVERLGGTIGPTKIGLRAPLALAWRAGTARFSGLDLAIGGGSVRGDGAIARGKLTLRVVAGKLPLHDLARIAGADLTGTLGFNLALAGTRRAPQGHLVLDAESVSLVAAGIAMPALGVVAEGDWRDGRLDMKGRIAAPHGTAIGWTAQGPLLLAPDRLAPEMPGKGAVKAHVEGGGDLADFAGLLPDAEDRIAGRFTIDVSVAGTVAHPAASGRIAVTGGRYESFATGAILTGVHFTLAGERDRLVLSDFTANDGAGGTLAMNGSVDLGAAVVPTLALSATFHRLRALNRDEATATASGTLRLEGPVTAPRVTAAVTIDRAEIAVPERLPQSLQPVAATVIDSATGATLRAPAAAQPPVLLTLHLDVSVDLPGSTFVRGRGLDSEWRGRLHIAGSPGAPVITGKLEVVRGTYDFLGKTFVVSKGTIAFLGAGTIDPTIDIAARAQSSDVTAIVTLTGTATRPSIQLSSQPALPRDEILARLLFGTSLSQVGPAQAFGIASAAASLAGGQGLDVLGRIRRGLGLDRLALGAAPTSVVSTTGIPSLSSQPGQPPATGIGTTPITPGAGTNTSVTGATISAGKYVANGVYVGVSQGLQASSSSVNVNIAVSRHISIDTEAGQSSGTGIGVNWKLDY